MSRVVSFTSIVAFSARRARPASSSRKAANPPRRSAPTQGPLVLRPTVTSFRRVTVTRAVGEEVEANPPSVSVSVDPPWTQPGYRGIGHGRRVRLDLLPDGLGRSHAAE